MSELAVKTVSAAKWGLLSAVAKFAMQLGVNIAVARLLGPDSYGLFALATLVLIFATFFSEFGLGWSLMQRETIDEESIRFVFTWQCISGLLGAAIMFVGAAAAAKFLHEPRLTEVVRWLALTCIFNAVASTASNLLRRELRFKEQAIVQVQSYASAYGLLGLPLAALGFGVWSLVAAWVFQAFLGAVLSFRCRPHPSRLLFRVAKPREFINFGFIVLVTNICNWLLLNADRFLIGRILGTHSAGLYAVGYNLASVPNGLLISALQPAFLASGARLQDQIPTLRKAYLEVQSFIWMVVAPVFSALALSGSDIVRILYGPNWDESGRVFVLLLMVMPAYLAWSMTTPILWNTGRRRLEVLCQIPLLLGGLAALVLASRFGLVAMAGVAAALIFLRFAVLAVPAARALKLSGATVLNLFCRAVMLNGLVLASGYLSGLIADHLNGHALLLLLSRTGGSALIAVLLWVSVPKLLGQPAATLLTRFLPTNSWLTRHFARHFSGTSTTR
ncbi:lipopolysaccharide biosynthesis protein [Paucibacter sp. B2R-40]|uniref:lipopolysaccharide biosynthesis protein n=1 Tax=Paucibacter sp. B2R-40 TaxID=2893554 RepID=UPI0021E47F46|nr:lipopolysaccharide biosynthesis protein [Paucibacter sp. B2R-40]MCV2357158.1 lipopolysaccharide biosynthesis protein [Paucibacter sp. B2R-40]